jgi:integrase/recombinase XerD
VDPSVIALWRGHESIDTIQIYLHSSMELKEKALAKTKPFESRSRQYRPPEQLLSFSKVSERQPG